MKRILVVDDDHAILTLLREALPLLGFEADFAYNGCEAMKLLRLNPYDLMLLDIRMPKQTGIEIATKANQLTPYLDIVFMSGKTNVQVEEQSFLPKPFTLDELEAKLASRLDIISTDSSFQV